MVDALNSVASQYIFLVSFHVNCCDACDRPAAPSNSGKTQSIRKRRKYENLFFFRNEFCRFVSRRIRNSQIVNVGTEVFFYVVAVSTHTCLGGVSHAVEQPLRSQLSSPRFKLRPTRMTFDFGARNASGRTAERADARAHLF